MRVALAFMIMGIVAKACVPDAAKLKQARSAYYEGVDGNDAQRQHGGKLFEELHKQCPSNPAVLAYWGSLQLVEASHTWAVWRKNTLSRQGVRAMDDAVAVAPENLEIRFVRAVTTYNLPSFFDRREQSASDFDFLSQRAEKAARQGHFDPRLAAASLYYHAEFLQKGGQKAEAIRFWKQAMQLAPHSRAARESATELKKIG